MADSIRDDSVQVRVPEGINPASVASLLRDRTGTAFQPLYTATKDDQDVTARNLGSGEYCSGLLLLVDDEAGWRALSGRPLTTAEKSALDRGSALGISPTYGPVIALLTDTDTRQPTTPLHVHPATVDAHTAARYGAVMWTTTARQRGLTPKFHSLYGDLPGIADQSTRQRIWKAAEIAGISAGDLTFGGQQEDEGPLILVFVVGEVLVLLLALVITAAVTVAAEERRTQQVLTSLGFKRPWRALVQAVTCGGPLLVGIVIGYMVGFLVSEIIAMAVVKYPLVVSPLGAIPLAAIIIFPPVAWLTTPKD